MKSVNSQHRRIKGVFRFLWIKAGRDTITFIGHHMPIWVYLVAGDMIAIVMWNGKEFPRITSSWEIATSHWAA